MKIVLDTNVLVSGIFWKGPPRLILDAWERGAFRLALSPPVLTEYERVLAELALNYPEVSYNRVLELIAVHAEVVSAVRFTRQICKDKDDDVFLGTALAAGASHLISGDKLLLAVNGFRGLRILQPKEFLKTLVEG